MTASRQRSWPYRLFLVALLIAAAGAVVFIVWGLPAVLTRHPHITSASDRHKAISDTRTGLIAAVVAAGAAGGLAYTARTYRLSQHTLALSEQGQFTDRYSKAIEQLGDKEKIEVRLGGIYALERLMADSLRDQPTILEVLAAWLRERTTSVTPLPEKVALDVQAALTVIGRRRAPAAHEHPIDLRSAHLDGADLSEARLDGANLSEAHLDNANLHWAHLVGANLSEAHVHADLRRARLDGADLRVADLRGADLGAAVLHRADLRRARLDGANLSEAHLEDARLGGGAHFDGATLHGAHLDGADLSEAHLDGANLIGAHLNRANLRSADLRGAHLDGADLHGADLAGADLSVARGLLQSQLVGSIVDKETKLPEGIHPPEAAPPPHG